MKNIFTKIALVTMAVSILPISSTFAGGSMPATTLSGSVSADNTIQLKWSTLEKNDYKYVYDFYDGYAVVMNDKPFALLKFTNNNYSYYNLSGMPKGYYNFRVDLYYYDVSGIHYASPSNAVALTMGEGPVDPDPKPEPKLEPKHIKLSADQSVDNKFILNWTAYTGSFDGYIVKLVEVAKKKNTYKEFPKTAIYYYESKDTTSFDKLNIASGHTYQVQVLPYLKNAQGTLDYVEKGKSEKKVIKLKNSEIVLSAISKGGKIEGSFTVADTKQIDGYAVYVVKGKQGEVALDTASPIYLGKDKTTFTAYPSDTGSFTIKVYAYNLLPSGTKLYQQPGSNWVTVENNIL